MSIGSTKPLTEVGFDSAGMVMTPAEFDAVETWEEGYRYELYAGALIVSPHPASPHNGINQYLGNVLFVYERSNPGTPYDGTLFESYVKTGDATRRCVNRAIWTKLNRDPELVEGVPSIVVEIVSPGKRARQRDYEEKRNEYLAIGVGEYWIIDRFDNTMTVFRSETDAADVSVHQRNDNFSTELLPGFVLNLDEMFAAGEKWENRES